MSKEAGSGNPNVITKDQKAQLEILRALPSSVYYNHIPELTDAFISKPENRWGIGCSNNGMLYCKLFNEGFAPKQILQAPQLPAFESIHALATYTGETSNYVTAVMSLAATKDLLGLHLRHSGDEDVDAFPLIMGTSSWSSLNTFPFQDLENLAVGAVRNHASATNFFGALNDIRKHHERYMTAVDHLIEKTGTQ